MTLELYCPRCACRRCTPETPATEAVMEHLWEGGLSPDLGDGATVEDWLCTALTANGEIACPQCHVPMVIAEESLGQLALVALAQW